MSEEKKTDDFVNVTDCLETITVFKSMKNLLFVIIFFAIVILLGCFILTDMGMVKIPGMEIKEKLVVKVEKPAEKQDQTIEPNSVESAIVKAVKKVTQDANIPAADKTESQPKAEETQKQETKITKYLTINFFYVARAVRICNFILVLSAILYALILMFSLKVSLVGRLGGMNHIARAFISSLFILVFIFPWQKYMGPVCIGAIYLPVELKEAIINKPDMNIFDMIIYYIRFVLWWIIVLILLFSAQRRTAKWSNATLKRLGIE